MKKARKRKGKHASRATRKTDRVDLAARVACIVLGVVLASIGSTLVVVGSSVSGASLVLFGVALVILSRKFKHIKIKTALLEVDAKER
jgi:hypothetical protein